MRPRLWLIGALLAMGPGAVITIAQTAPLSLSAEPAAPGQPATQPANSAADSIPPISLSIAEPESVYPPPSARPDDEGVNSGAMHYHLDVSFMNRYVYRGVDQTTNPDKSENSLQFDGNAELDLGHLPHPFVGLFVNVFDQDPVSRFEEVRPYLGLRWLIKPLTLTGGYNSYIFPNRETTSDTQEVFTSVSLDDSRIWKTANPLLSPYIYAAYDFDRYQGVYLELGLRHDFQIGDSGITLSPQGSVAYILKDRYFLKPGFDIDSGWQHYEAGLVGSYLLNQGLGFSKRYGEWRVVGYLFYDDGLQKDVRANSRLWGGVGLSFDY